MKKKSVALLLAFMFTLVLPFSAMASNSSKGLFMDNMKTQQDKQIQPNLERPLIGEINVDVAGEPLDTFGFENVKANIKYEIDMAKDQAFFQVDASVEGSEPKQIKMDFYLVDDTMIIPVESLQAMTQFNPSMELPADNIQYVYTKLEGFSLTELQTVLNQSEQQEEAMELVKTIFEAVPDSCFSTSGTTATMNLNKLAIINYAKNFKDEAFVSKLGEQMFAFSPEGTDKDEFTEDFKVADDVSFVTLLKNLNIRKCSTEIGPSTSAIDWDFSYSTEEMIMDCKVTSKSKLEKDNNSSTTSMDFGIKSPDGDKDLAVKLNGNSTANTQESSAAMKIQVTGDIEGQNLDIVANLNVEQAFKDAVSFVAPVLTEENSIDSEVLEPEIDDSDWEDQITVNINDYDNYIWFDNAPFIEKGHVLVPAREFTENLAGEITWNPSTSLVLSIADQKISMNIGDTHCIVNDQNKEMDNAPVIKDGVAYIPVRFIAEELGYEASYDQECLEVCLTSASSEK